MSYLFSSSQLKGTKNSILNVKQGTQSETALDEDESIGRDSLTCLLIQLAIRTSGKIGCESLAESSICSLLDVKKVNSAA